MLIRSGNSILVSMLVGMLTGGFAPAAAHGFTVAIVGDGLAADTEAQVAEVVRGFIVATDERDDHGNMTSDGHLGGLDVQIWVLPSGGATGVEELVGHPHSTADIALLLGPVPSAMGIGDTALGRRTIIFRPGTLPQLTRWQTSGFAERFAALFGRAPTEAAAQGYNAARRIDHAIRLLDGLEPLTAVEAALVATERRMDW